MYANVLSENDSNIGRVWDILSVCVRDCIGGNFKTNLSEP